MSLAAQAVTLHPLSFFFCLRCSPWPLTLPVTIIIYRDPRDFGQAHLLKDAVAKGAVCLDGTPPLYYLRKGTGASPPYLHFIHEFA